MVGLRFRNKHKDTGPSSRVHRNRVGRPLRLPNQSTRVQILERLKTHHAAIQYKTSMDTERLSQFERLPVELIQHIFFFALEINLPRASEHLRQVLSTDQIYNALIIFAYFDDDGVSPVETKHFLPAEYRVLHLEDKVRLQQSLFTCRWGTPERVFSCVPALKRLVVAQAWHREQRLSELHSVQGAGGTIVVADSAVRDLAPLPDLHDDNGLDLHFFSTQNYDIRSGRKIFPSHIITWTASLDSQGTVHKTTDQPFPTMACRHFPNKLLQGPWTFDHVLLMRWLRQGYASVQDDHVMSISAKAVFNGMRRAIREGNDYVLKVLLDLQNVLFKSRSWDIQHMMSTRLIAASYHPLPVDLFHLATQQQATCHDETNTAREKRDDSLSMSLLIRGGIDSLPLDDVIVTAWALQRSQTGDETANFLIQHMEGTATYGLPRRRHLFVDGGLSWRAQGVPFPTSSFANELGYTSRTPIVPAGIDGRNCGDEDE